MAGCTLLPIAVFGKIFGMDVGVGHLITPILVFVLAAAANAVRVMVVVVVVVMVVVVDFVIVVTAALDLTKRTTRYFLNPFFRTVALAFALALVLACACTYTFARTRARAHALERIGNSVGLRGLLLLFRWLAGAEVYARGCICR